MKYFSLKTVVDAYRGFQDRMTNKSWGYLALIKGSKNIIQPSIPYEVDLDEVSNFLEGIFNLSEKKKQYNNGRSLYVVFSKKWEDYFNYQGKTTPSIYDIIVWSYRKKAIPENTTHSDLIKRFAEEFNIPKNIITNSFDLTSKNLEFSDTLYSESSLKNELVKFGVDVSSNNIDAKKNSVVASPGEISRGPFVQTLYAGLDITDYVIILQSNYYSLYGKKEELEQLGIEDPQSHKQFNKLDIDVIVSSLLSTGLIYSETLIKRLAYSLMAKPFVILSGLAGSGKTQLALAFAKCLSENIEEQVCTVSIGADWTNREPLLGYPNALKENEYVLPESGVLQLLMRANEDPDKPYFLILDEMNLSVVERYFADFLSAMESGEKIKLWDNEKGNVPKEIKLPKNVFIIGTINVDETTYMFSPKVLDRANVIEFKIAADEMEDYLGKKVNINLEQAYSACADMAVDFVNKTKSQVEKDEKNKDILLSFFKELKEVNAEFGYRTVNEISRYLHFSDGELTADSAIDTAILQKLLPKLHGSRKKLVPVLTSLWKLCLKDGVTKEIDAEFDATDFKYPESAEKIQRMYHAVVDNGFTSFAEA